MVMDRRIEQRQAVKLAAIPALSLVVAAATPVGPRLLLVPVSVRDYTGFVSEWDPPNIRDPFVAATFIMVVVIAVRWAREGAATWSDILTWCLALGWTLLY
jgi:hypothetical protein